MSLALVSGSFLPVRNLISEVAPIVAYASVTGAGTAANPYLITSGQDLINLLTSSSTASPVYINVQNDISVGGVNNLPTNLTAVVDMGGHALYTNTNLDNGGALFRMSNGDNITFQNENIVSTGISTSLTGPNQAGTGNQTVYYNSWYGIFGCTANTSANLTYKNVTQNFASITSWGGYGQPFYNYGIAVNFSGTNYFNYSGSGQEFMEGNGINVLDGKTTIVQNTTASIINAGSTGTPIINVASGATLNLTASSTAYGLFYGVSGIPLSIINNGTLTMNLSGAGISSTNFYSGFTPSSITMNFGANSTTTINSPGLFNFGATAGAFLTTIGSNATFDYSTGNTTNAFIGTPTTSDSFTINSAKHVRFNTTRTSATSILGTDTSAMPIKLIATSPQGYQINGYNSSGTATITGSGTTGAFADTGTFHSSLSDLTGLTGVKVATASEVTTYQAAAQLEFNLVMPAQANFSYAWASNVPGQNSNPGNLNGTLPSTVTQYGGPGAAIQTPTLSAAPAGYTISGYKAPNGTIYSTLAAAIASDTGTNGVAGTYGGTSNNSSPNTYTPGTNDFQVILSANAQTAQFSWTVSSTTPATGIPSTITANGITGNTYASTASSGGLTVTATPVTGGTSMSVTNNVQNAVPIGYYISSIKNNVTGAVATGTYSATATAATNTNSTLTATPMLNGTASGVSFANSSLDGTTNSPNYTITLSPMPTAAGQLTWVAAAGTVISSSLTPSTINITGLIGQNYGTTVSSNGATPSGGKPDGTTGSTSSVTNDILATGVIPPGYYLSKITNVGTGGSVSGTSSSATLTAAGDTTVFPGLTGGPTSTNFSASNSYGSALDGAMLTMIAANNNYVLTLTAIQQTISYVYQNNTGESGLSMPSNPANTTIGTGSPLTTPTGFGTAPTNTYISGYTISGDSTVYPTLTALLAVHPTVPANSLTVTAIISDATALSSKPSDTITRSASFTPSVELTASGTRNGNGSTPTNLSVVNGSDVTVTITNNSGTPAYSYSGNASTPIPANSLVKGSYTITYTTHKADGTTVVTTTTQLNVTNFTLPFTGGQGMTVPIGLAASAGVMGLMLRYFGKNTGLHGPGSKKRYVGKH